MWLNGIKLKSGFQRLRVHPQSGANVKFHSVMKYDFQCTYWAHLTLKALLFLVDIIIIVLRIINLPIKRNVFMVKCLL